MLLNKHYYSSYKCCYQTIKNSDVFCFKKYFIQIAKLYIFIVLVNIKNIHVKYSHCEPIHFKSKWISGKMNTYATHFILKWHYAPLMKILCEMLKLKITVYLVTCVHRSILNNVSTKL